jgi:CelD/BcsL family acetyltransferase involved in cellulose biosynthesis
MREVTGDLYHQWQQLLVRSGASCTPFLHPEFASLAATVGRPVNVAVAEQGGELVSLFPFEQVRSGVASPIGARVNDFQGVLTEQRRHWSAAEFFRQSKINRVQFDHLLEVDHAFPVVQGTTHRSPYIDLSAGFEAYRSQLKFSGNKHLEQIYQKQKKGEKQGFPIRFTYHNPSSEVLEQLFRWKQSQYERTQALDVFRFEWVRKMMQRVAKMQQPDFGGVVSTLHSGGDLVAIHLGMYAGKTLHYWFPAYDAEHPAAKYAPGLQLLAHMLQNMSGHGLTRLDFGRGEERYKQELATGDMAVSEGIYGQPSWERRWQSIWSECRQGVKNLVNYCGLESAWRGLRQYHWQSQMR